MRIEAEKTEEEVKQLEEERAAEKIRKEKTKVKYSLKEEIARFKELKGEEKFWYIWEYYKFHILITIGAVIVGVLVARSVLDSMKPTILQGYLVNTYYGEEDSSFMTDGYLEDRGYSVSKNKLYFDDSIVVDNGTGNVDAQFALASTTKIVANVQAADLDFMIVDDFALKRYCGEQIFADLQEVLPAETFDLLLEQDRLVKAEQIFSYEDEMETIPKETKEIYAGIRLDSTAFSETMKVDSPCYYTIIFNSKRQETAIDYLDYLMEGPANSRPTDPDE